MRSDLLHDGCKVGMEKEALSLTIIEDKAKVLGRQTDIQRQEDTVGQDNSVIGLKKMMGVVRQESDSGRGIEPPGKKETSQAVTTLEVLFISPGLLAIHNTHFFAKLVPCPVKKPNLGQGNLHFETTKIWVASSSLRLCSLSSIWTWMGPLKGPFLSTLISTSGKIPMVAK